MNDVQKKNNGITNRLVALDFARCIAMFMMVQGHVIYELTNPVWLDPNNIYTKIWLFARGLTAPIFLTVSGAVQVFANKRDENGRILPGPVSRRTRTALLLILIGYMMMFPVEKVFHLAFIPHKLWVIFFQINILQLIGVSILLLLAVFKLVRNEKLFAVITFVIGLSLFFATPYILAADMYKYLPEFIAPYFSYKKGTLFGITPFTGYMFLGASFGTLIKLQSRDKRILFIKTFGFVSGIIIIIASFFIYNYYQQLNLVNEFKHLSNPGVATLRLGVVFVSISLITFLYQKTTGFSKWYSLFGRRALFVYIIHLILIYGTPWNVSLGQIFHQSVPLYFSIPIAWLVVIASGYLAWLYDKAATQNEDTKLLFRYIFMFFFVFIIFI